MGTSELDGSGRVRSGSDRAHPLAATRPGFIEPSDDVRVLRHVAWPGLTRPLDEMVAAPSGLWIVEHRPWQDIAVARGRVITADADVTLDVQHLDQVRVRVARDLGLTPVEAHALVVVPEEVPALRLEGVIIVGQRLVRQIILSPGRRLTPTQLDVLARRTAKVLSAAAPDRPQAPPGVAVVPDPAPAPAPVAERPASSPFSRLPGTRPAPPMTASDRPRQARVPSEPVPSTEPMSVAVPDSEPPTPDPGPAAAARSASEPTVPVPTAAHEDPAFDPTEYDEAPAPLPTPEEMGLPPALLDPPAQRQAAHEDPIWPIAPPPGLSPAPEPEPELARLVVSADAQVELDESEPDLERTRVVESASAVPEVDEDESEMGRTRVVDHPADEPQVTPERGLPRLVEPATDHPWTEPAGEEPTDGEIGPGRPGPQAIDPQLIDPEPVGTQLSGPETIEPERVSPDPFASTSFDSEPYDSALVDAALVDSGPAEPELVDAEPTSPGLFGGPEPTATAPFGSRLTEPEPVEPFEPEPTATEPFGSRLTEPEPGDLGPVDPEPIDQEMITELVKAGLVGPELIADLIDARLIDRELIVDLIDPELMGALVATELGPVGPDAELIDLAQAEPAVRAETAEPDRNEPHLAEQGLVEPDRTEPDRAEHLAEPHPAEAEPDRAEPHLTEPRLAEPSLAEPSLAEPSLDALHRTATYLAEPEPDRSEPCPTDDDADYSSAGQDRLVPPAREDSSAPTSDDEPHDGPVEVYGPLDEDVELTRIRPPDRPPATQSLADARRAFFSGAADDPVTAFPQMPEEELDESAARRHPPLAQARRPDRLPVEWDDEPVAQSDGTRPHVDWDPPEAPHRGRPRAGGDPVRDVARREPGAPRSDRRSVVAGPRPPTDRRPVEHTERPARPVERPALPVERPARPVERPSRPRLEPAARPTAPPHEPVPAPPAERTGGPAPSEPAGPSHPPRPRAVRTGPWDLSPAQAAAVGGRYPGPVRIRGAFGTGRSVAAAYRAVHLAQTRPGLVGIVVPAAAQVEPMHRRLAAVADVEVLERIVVDVPSGIAQSLLAEFGTEVNLAPESVARAWSVAQRSTGLGAAQGRSIGLLLDEVALIRGRSLTDEADYDRLRQEMPSGLRHQVWALHEAYLAELRQRNLPDEHDLVRMARAALRAGVPSELTAVVVDDANDLTLDQLRMLRETVGTGTDALTVLDDGLPGLLPAGATLDEAGIDIAQRQVELSHEFRLTGPAWTSLVRMLQPDNGRDIVGTTSRPRLTGRLDDGEGPAYLRSQAIRLRRDRLVERVAELVGGGVPPESIALLHVEDEPEPELVAELVRAGVMVRGLDALDVPAVALGRARDARGVEFDHVLVPDARHRDVVPVGGLRWDQRQRRRLLGLALSRSRETAWIAGV